MTFLTALRYKIIQFFKRLTCRIIGHRVLKLKLVNTFIGGEFILQYLPNTCGRCNEAYQRMIVEFKGCKISNNKYFTDDNEFQHVFKENRNKGYY
jgi:hypothetical protein